MLNKIKIAALLFNTALSIVPTSAIANDPESSFSLSDTFQTSVDALADSRDSLRSEIGEALAGLSREEARDVRDTYAEDVEALRDESRSLRSEVSSELDAAGIVPPHRGGEAPENGAAGRGGPDGTAGPDGHGSGDAGPGSRGGAGSSGGSRD